MADALCGPSNALQNFQKHAAVDRSLQQDRVGFRQSPSQSFRSSPAPGASHVDAEFQAFQAGPPLLQEPLPFHAPRFPQVQAPSSSLPNWAADFQQLRLNDAASHRGQSLPTGQASMVPNGWQHEFFRQQQHASAPRSEVHLGPSPWQSHMSAYSPMTVAGMFGPSQYKQTQQPPQEAGFDDAAFARAFEDVESQIDKSHSKGKEKAVEREPVVKFDLSHASMEMGDVTGEYDYDANETALASEYQSTLREAGWDALDAFQRAHEHEFQTTGSRESLDAYKTIEKMRSDGSPKTQTPEPATQNIRIGADTIPETQQQAEPASAEAEADELARTAGQLIENLKDEHSTKFQQSNFMLLMRQLRDKEVRVEGDTMMKQAPHPGGVHYPRDAFAKEDNGTSELQLGG